MPNHFMSKIYLEGDPKRIQELLEHVKYDDGDIGSLDCNKVIPMPKDLDLESGSIEWESICAYLSKVNPVNMNFQTDHKLPNDLFKHICDELADVFGIRPIYTNMSYEQIVYIANTRFNNMPADKFIDLGNKYISNLLKYGATSWYYWCRDNWGSAYNTYGAEPFVNNTMTFKTGNSPVSNVINEIGEMYPDIKITYKYADEDFGRNTGVMELYKHGLEGLLPAEYSDEAFDIVKECWSLSDEELEKYKAEFKE